MTIFISHSSKDQTVARTLCNALEARGLRCWVASRDVDPGGNFQESIVKAIREAKVMVLVFTKNANRSAEIKKEIALASQHELVVIPVRIEDVMPNDALAYELATRQWVDLFQDWERAIERLTARIGAVVAVETQVCAAGQTVAANQHPASAAASANPIGMLARRVLSLNIHLLGCFLLNITVFLLALMMLFLNRENFAGALAATVLGLLVGAVGRRILEKDESVRTFGMVIGIVGVLAVGAVSAAPYFIQSEFLADRSIQNGNLMAGIYFMATTMFFASEWKKLSQGPAWTPYDMTNGRLLNLLLTRWGSGLVFVSSLLLVTVTWQVIYSLTESVVALLVLITCHVGVVGWCNVRFRKDVGPPVAEPEATALPVAAPYTRRAIP